ncbi:MAG: tRNA (N(6)-L-threonylcarbamoyladenosine(37)-C(2))-methylthiotransferase MtaB [Rhodospirillaceae bacterium]|nr:tRNA (N(6)-L-threonylcarbamoyladenosine(37)-C(2))-methylthiotransferase MtaB [Magnetovibrio sp.]MAY65882.1 tRNA (N(6)-L-threonylcarbamoyladenosine(37)-C(2))-methylthiotransferase MtaB [Rhodospirillaceae bacterium]
MSGADVITLGCRLNAFESEVMRANAARAGLADAIIVNTCAVTAEAERQARQTIRRARRDRPGAKVIVTGCAAQLDPAKYAAMPEVDRVLGNEEKLDPEAFRLDGPDIQVADIMAIKETAAHLIDGFDGRARAFVQVQQGCDHRCTFCIIPFARGNNRSLAMGAIADQVRSLVAKGYREVVLTGVDICSYGTDLPGTPTLGHLVRRLLKAVPELERLRLSSLDPAAMDDELFRALAEEDRLMPHLHLSLQAMDDMVLKRMKRRHSRDDAYEVAERARQLRPDLVLGADLIAGFPTETQAMHDNTLAAVRDLDLVHLHVFPYSERDGTPAAKMPTVDVPERKARAAQLRGEGDANLARFLSATVGQTVPVLIERDAMGYSPQYAPVHLDVPVAEGTVVAARITGVRPGGLTGTPA